LPVGLKEWHRLSVRAGSKLQLFPLALSSESADDTRENENSGSCLEMERGIRYSDNQIMAKAKKITVTEASRNFADCVNRARYQNLTFMLMKNGETVAKIVPGGEKICTAGDLADVLEKAHLSEENARAWRRDLKAARKRLKPPVDKWR
jgi:antitoxin (DNA-binding transcriptional repressor) of toxin-antitoxin stability system